MKYEEGLRVEEAEELRDLLRHPGMKHVFGIVNEIVDLIQKDMLRVPVYDDPEKAGRVLYSKQMEWKGADALRNALLMRVKALKYGETKENNK